MVQNPIKPFLDRFGVAILDGGLATELERRGADLNDPLWSARMLVDAPDLIRAVHFDYFQAGADVATSASYQASFEGFARLGLDESQAAKMMQRSVELAREARALFWAEKANRAGRLFPLLAASLGCYGAFLHDGSEYRGDYPLSAGQLMDFHRPRLAVLAQSGADLMACETIPCRLEAEALLRLLEEFPETPAWLSFSCQDGEHVCHGEKLADCLALADASDQIVAAGVNCTSPSFIPALLDSVAGKVKKPLLVYPNQGERWDALRGCWLAGPERPIDWGQAARDWYSRGARLVGGCCRTTPAQIRQIAQALRPQAQK